ncbi:MAG: CDP-diacylglycerol--glycerol-3-phosphate 3-phosphatidyltransferase [Clostridia bacterium]|nr:CDP-diacylglycerol--glycerol-3-phosphate 3-phosphatidyltransferase [Clostridia bacterium]
MNTPNKLTVLRMILVPIMLVASLINIPGEILNIPISWWIMDLLFVIGAITDKIDGTLARKRNQVTNFGKFLDPIADKIIVISALIILVGQLKIPTWIPVIVIIREFAVSGYRLIAVESNGEVIAANKWGKIKTVTQMLAITIAFLDKNPFGTIFMGDLDTIPFIINLVNTLLMTISVIATIFSGYEYLKDGKDLLKDM